MLVRIFMAFVLCAALCCAVLVWHRSSGYRWSNKMKRTLVPVLLAVLLLFVLAHARFAREDTWNAARLAPSVALLKGYRLYSNPDSGPVTGHIYGPIPALYYMPAALFQSPSTALVVACFLTILCYCLPAIWLITKASSAGTSGSSVLNSVYLCVFFLFATLTSPALSYTAFRVHCDAPALGFATLAIGTLALIPNRTLSYLCSAVFASLAFWCKVTLVGLFPALLIAVWIVDGWKFFIKYALYLFSVVAAVSATIFLVFGLEETAFNVFLVPVAHPWGNLREWNPGDVLKLSYPDSLTIRVKHLLLALGSFCTSSGITFAALVFPGCLYFFLRKQSQKTGRSFHLLTVCLLLAFLIFLPISIAARAKVGGDVNNCAPSLFFALVLASVLLGFLLNDNAQVEFFPISQTAFFFVSSIICWVIITIGPQLVYPVYRELTVGPQANRITQVYQYSLKHPGEVYFPWYPLPCLMGEGQLYHFSYGVFDRELAGRPLSEEHFLKYTPPHSQYVCFQKPPEDIPQKYVLSYLRNYHKVPAPAGLEDWEVYQRD